MQARNLVNDVRHCSDLKITKAATDDTIGALTTLLSDKCLDGYRTAVSARNDLLKVRRYILRKYNCYNSQIPSFYI